MQSQETRKRRDVLSKAPRPLWFVKLEYGRPSLLATTHRWDSERLPPFTSLYWTAQAWSRPAASLRFRRAVITSNGPSECSMRLGLISGNFKRKEIQQRTGLKESQFLLSLSSRFLTHFRLWGALCLPPQANTPTAPRSRQGRHREAPCPQGRRGGHRKEPGPQSGPPCPADSFPPVPK